MLGRHIVSSFVSNYCFATLSCSVSLDMTATAFAMRVLISASSDRLLSIVKPQYMKHVLKAYDSIMEKNMLNSVGARTHPCFTPLWIISNGSGVAPS